MLNFSEAKTILESLTKLVKKAATLDLQEKIVNLREFILSLKDENITLREENQTLKLHIETEQNFSLRSGVYWKEGDDVPFCQKCHESSRKRIHLQKWGDGWKCFECSSFYTKREFGGIWVNRPRINEAL